jgi:Glutathione S-transferase, C-terminal domain
MYANYTIPPACRKAAISRTAAYGTGFLQTDLEDSSDSSSTVNTRSGGVDPVPGSTSSSLLFGLGRQHFSRAQKIMRLNTILARPMDALKSLDERLSRNGNSWITREDKPSILDAVVIGYLALILSTKVPDQWAAEMIEDKVPRLAKWAKDRADTLLKDIEIP